MSYLFLHRVTVNQLRDFKWHQICVTWSGFTGVVHYYLDGKVVLSAKNKGRGEIPGGDHLVVGSDQHLLSEFNLWNRVLTAQEIASNAKKCDGGKGNVIQWHQAFTYLKKYKKTYKIPSVCKVPNPNAEKATGSTTSDLSRDYNHSI